MTEHGGKRVGAGRPKGKGKYGEPTELMRIPLSKLSEVKRFLDNKTSLEIPLYASKIRAGFPSPADDYVQAYLDLNEHLVKHPAATFFLIAEGDSMTGAGIQSGDMLIVDRSLEATHNKIVIAAVDGELTVKRLAKQNGRVQLLAANPKYSAIDITEEQELVIFGVVTYILHKAK